MALMTGPATCLVCQRDERAGPWADLNCPESTLRGCQPVTGLNASCPLFRLGHSAMSAQCPDAPECMDPPCVARENGEPGVRSCTNVSGLALELVLRTIMEIRAHPILLAAMPLRAISGVSSRMRREDQFSISSLSLSQTSVGKRLRAHMPFLAIIGIAPLASSI
jgi:hypothetical protein